MDWDEVPRAVDEWAAASAAPAQDLRREAAGVVTATPVGYYYDPRHGRVGVFAPDADPAAAARAVRAATRAAGEPPVRLDLGRLSDPAASWVKVAYSPLVRTIGEHLNFFPGQYFGVVPNHASPLAAVLTSGLVGAGLGWGGGRALARALPEGYGGNLPRTGLLAGLLAGVAPGLAWGLLNLASGRPFNDPSLFAGRPGDPAEVLPPEAYYGANADPVAAAVAAGADKAGADADAAAGLVLGRDYRRAAEKAASLFGRAAGPRPFSEADVHVDRLGRTLWDSAAPPPLAATTMGAVYAAQRLPDPYARPGWVTGHQLGQLAANAASDYATGVAVGTALNALVGTPWRPPAFGAGAAALGVISNVVPKLFGR